MKHFISLNLFSPFSPRVVMRECAVESCNPDPNKRGCDIDKCSCDGCGVSGGDNCISIDRCLYNDNPNGGICHSSIDSCAAENDFCSCKDINNSAPDMTLCQGCTPNDSGVDACDSKIGGTTDWVDCGWPNDWGCYIKPVAYGDLCVTIDLPNWCLFDSCSLLG